MRRLCRLVLITPDLSPRVGILSLSANRGVWALIKDALHLATACSETAAGYLVRHRLQCNTVITDMQWLSNSLSALYAHVQYNSCKYTYQPYHDSIGLSHGYITSNTTLMNPLLDDFSIIWD